MRWGGPTPAWAVSGAQDRRVVGPGRDLLDGPRRKGIGAFATVLRRTAFSPRGDAMPKVLTARKEISTRLGEADRLIEARRYREADQLLVAIWDVLKKKTR